MIIEQAKKYLGINYDGKIKVMDYYNENCYPLVKKAVNIKLSPTITGAPVLRPLSPINAD